MFKTTLNALMERQQTMAALKALNSDCYATLIMSTYAEEALDSAHYFTQVRCFAIKVLRCFIGTFLPISGLRSLFVVFTLVYDMELLRNP